jgi:hypothetical protein
MNNPIKQDIEYHIRQDTLRRLIRHWRAKGKTIHPRMVDDFRRLMSQAKADLRALRLNKLLGVWHNETTAQHKDYNNNEEGTPGVQGT